MRFIYSLANLIRLWMAQPKFWYAVLVCYMVVLAFLSLNPWVLPTSTESIFSPDKLDHAVAYGGLAIILFFCLQGAFYESFASTRFLWLLSLLISTFTGILIEIAQSLFTTNRIGSVEDAVANAVGAGTGYATFYLMKCVHAKIAA